MNKTYVYHHNDHDGIVAAGVLYYYLMKTGIFIKDDFVFNMIDYDKKLNFDHIDFKDDDEVFFLDYSFSNEDNIEEFKKLLDRRIDGREVIWIDHHKSSIGMLEEYNISGIRNKELCGAALTYLWFTDAYDPFNSLSTKTTPEYGLSEIFHESKAVPKFLKYIDDYDCWKHLYSNTNDFHYGLIISNPTDMIIDRFLSYSDDIMADTYINTCLKGKEVQAYLNFEHEEYHVKMYGFEFTLPEEHGGLKCFCLNRKGNSIMFGDKLDEYDAVIPFFFVNGKWRYSIFSNKEHIDCCDIAKTYGGGGHKGAAGWTIDEFIFKE